METTQELKTKLLEEQKEVLFSVFGKVESGEPEEYVIIPGRHYEVTKPLNDFLSSALSQMEDAVREEMGNILNTYPPRSSEWNHWTTDIQNGYCKGEVAYRKYILESLKKEKATLTR